MNNTTETENICGLKRSDFQTTIGGKQTDLYILKNSQGNEVAITNYGGAIVAIMVPDKNGKHANVAMTTFRMSSIRPSLIFQHLLDATATESAKDSSSSTARYIISPSTMVLTACMAARKATMPRFGKHYR